MTLERARHLLLDRLASATMLLLVVLLDLRDRGPVEIARPPWCDGTDAEGRAVFLVGRHALGDSDSARDAVQAVLDALQAGDLPEAVHAVAYAPAASRLIAEVVAGDSREILADGPRGSGKTQAVPGALAILAERHARAGFPLPLLAMWLHDSLTNAAVKTGRSLEQPLWGGLWRLQDDRREAVLTLAGTDLVKASFVGTRDETSQERLRMEAHVLLAEEVVPSLDDAGGIEERKYELGLTSLRLPTPRRVALSTTNPGAPDTWPYRRWIEGGGRPGCVRCPVPAEDRLTAAEVAALCASFRDSPDLAARLGRGEWAELILGEVVAAGFHREAHVAPHRLEVTRAAPIIMGHDAGLTPVTIILQDVAGEVRVLAALASDRAGTRQHLESLVLPWLATHVPWWHGSASSMVHYHDPAMDTPDQSNLESSPVRVLREILGGMTVAGATSWPGRRDPMLSLFTRLNPATGKPVLQLCPEGCSLLISALAGRWHYATVNGKVNRELPTKDHPWSDLGDAFAYVVGGVAPGPMRPAVVPTWHSAITSFDIFRMDRDGQEGQADTAYDRSRGY